MKQKHRVNLPNNKQFTSGHLTHFYKYVRTSTLFSFPPFSTCHEVYGQGQGQGQGHRHPHHHPSPSLALLASISRFAIAHQFHLISDSVSPSHCAEHRISLAQSHHSSAQQPPKRPGHEAFKPDRDDQGSLPFYNNIALLFDRVYILYPSHHHHVLQAAGNGLLSRASTRPRTGKLAQFFRLALQQTKQ